MLARAAVLTLPSGQSRQVLVEHRIVEQPPAEAVRHRGPVQRLLHIALGRRVQSDHAGQLLGRRMPGRAQERLCRSLHQVADLAGQVRGSGGPQTHHGDTGTGPSHPLGRLPG